MICGTMRVLCLFYRDAFIHKKIFQGIEAHISPPPPHQQTQGGTPSYTKRFSKELKHIYHHHRRISKHKATRTYQPTYRLDPKTPFNVNKVETIMKRIVEPELDELEYSDRLAPELCLTLADSIRTAVKEEQFDRYRLIVTVTIGQKRQQSTQMYHSFLWDAERDRFATHICENNHLYIHSLVYGVYLD